MLTRCKNWVGNVGVSPRKIWRPKTKISARFRKSRDMITNIYGFEQDIVDRKTALQTAITPVRAHQIW